MLVLERFRESAELIRHVLGWRDANTTAHRGGTGARRVTKTLRTLPTIRGWGSPATRARLARMEALMREQNNADLELYALAHRVLDEQLTELSRLDEERRRGGPAFQAGGGCSSGTSGPQIR